MNTRNEVAMRRQPNQIKTHPAKTNRYETNRDVSLPSRKTRKSTQAAKLETLRRKTIRSEKYGSAK